MDDLQPVHEKHRLIIKKLTSYSNSGYIPKSSQLV